jgi:hypothetical protein
MLLLQSIRFFEREDRLMKEVYLLFTFIHHVEKKKIESLLEYIINYVPQYNEAH